MKSIVVAYDKKRGIGANGRPLWNSGLMQADSRRFRTLTANSSVIMGRNAFETFHGFLPGRQNIVITRRERMSMGVQMVHSIGEAFEVATSTDINVIGGASIYKEALPYVDRVYATELNVEFRGSDAFFPELNPMQWREVSREYHAADELNTYDYSFVVYERA